MTKNEILLLSVNVIQTNWWMPQNKAQQFRSVFLGGNIQHEPANKI